MDWINYHHLLYFWMVAREGSIAAACEQLHLTQPTISSQLRKLEQKLGEDLFRRQGRRLVLTEAGQLVFRYADEIFSIGRELQEAIQGRPTGRPARLAVGIPDVLPKLITWRLLEPAFRLDEPVHVVCHEGKLDQLLADLAVHNLDVVFSDSPASPLVSVKAYNHLLGECGVSFFGTDELAGRYRRGFPKSLDGAPLLLPTDNTLLRRSLQHWLDSQDLHPRIVGEIEDSALMKEIGHAGIGLFAAPTAIEQEIRRQYRVRVIGRVDSVRESFYAITVERRLKHPAIVAISEAARDRLFQEQRERQP